MANDTKKLIVGSESFDYPITGGINYGEQASNWAEAVSEALLEVFGPGDIKTTSRPLANGGSGNITSFFFDTFVDQFTAEGYITRELLVGNDLVQSFVIQGTRTGLDYNFSVEYSGDDTFISFDMNEGQVLYIDEANQALKDNTDETSSSGITIKFKASTLITTQDD